MIEWRNFITALMKKMTLEEKIGQLNLVADRPKMSYWKFEFFPKSPKKFRQGKVGGVFNVKSIERILELQTIAVKVV